MANPLDIILNLRANTSGFDSGVQGAKSAVNALVGAMAALGVGLSVKSLLDTADQFTTLQAKIRVAVGDTGNFQQAMAGVYQVAIQTNANLDDTANLFARLSDTGRQMGLSQQQVLEITKTINQAVKVGGGTAEASSAAVKQLIQALQSGVLRGDEFNSIMEQAPAISKALAASLGVTTGELRKMAEEGKLSAETVVKALQGQASSIQSQYDQFPITVSNALQRISTAWTMLIGEMDQANGASTRVAEMLVYIADNLGELKKYFDDAANGVGYLVDKMQGIDPAVIDALKVALSSAYEATKQLAAQAVEGFEITIDVVDDALKAIFGFMTTAEQAEEGVSGFKKALDAVNIIIGLLRDGFSGISIAMSALTGLTYDIAAAWLNLRAKFSWGETKQQFIADSQEMATKASEHYATAQEKLMSFQSKTLEAGYQAQKTQAQINQDRIADNVATLQQLQTAEQTAITEQQASNEKRKQLDADLANARASNNRTAINTIMAQLAELDKSDDVFTKANIDRQNEKLKAAQEYAQAAIIANDGVLTGEMQRDLIAKGFIVTQEKLGEVTVKAFGAAAEASETFGLSASEAAKRAAKALGVDLDIALNRVSNGFNGTIKKLNQVAGGFDDLKNAGVNASNLIYAAWQKVLAGAKNQAEIDVAKQALIDLGKEGKIATGDVALGLQDIKDRAAKVSPEIDAVTAAFERLGIKTKEQLKLAAQSALADFSTIAASGQGTAEDVRKAYERTMQAAIASGDAAVIGQAKAKASAAGLTVAIDETGKVTTKTYAEIVSGADNTSKSVDRISNSFDRAGQAGVSAARATAAAWDNTVTSLSRAAEKLDALTKASGGTTGSEFLDGGKDTRFSGNSLNLPAYSQDQIAEKLVSELGYDKQKANLKAKDIFNDQTWAKGGASIDNGQLGISSFGEMSNGNYVDKLVDKLANTSNGATVGSILPTKEIPKIEAQNPMAKIDNTLNKLAQAANNQPTKTVNVNVTMGSRTVKANVPESQEGTVLGMLSEFERLKKGM